MTEVIVEIAQAHDGSLGILHSYIDAVAATGADAIKFQTHIAEAESSPLEPFRVKFSRVDKTRQDYWKRMQFSLDQWREIKAHCDDAGLEFMSSPFSNAAVDLLEEIGMARYKIGSGEVTNHLLLEKIGKTGKPIILSSGMSNLEELDATIEFLNDMDCNLTLLQCTTEYPTPPEHTGLNVLNVLKDRYRHPVGLSDHSGTPYPSLAATALGASIIEIHGVFDRKMFGPDASSSLTMDELKQLVEGVRAINTMQNNPVDKTDHSRFEPLKGMFEKTLAINANLAAGHKIRFEDLESKKPSNQGIAASKYREVIGRKLKHNLTKWSFITEADLL